MQLKESMRPSKSSAVLSMVWGLSTALSGCASAPLITVASADKDFDAQRYPQAAHQYLVLSRQGDAHIYSRLGYLYESGLATGNAQPGMALTWYEMAADKGDTDSAAALGNLYQWYNGYYEAAFKWDTKAAQAGNSMAAANLAALYSHGLGVTRNYTVAQAWQAKADQQPWGDMSEFSTAATSAIAVHMWQAKLPIPKGATGIAEVGFDYDGDGQAANVQIARSSGDKDLDSLALRAVGGAVLPPLPPQVKDKYSRFVIYIDFFHISQFRPGVIFWPG